MFCLVLVMMFFFVFIYVFCLLFRFCCWFGLVMSCWFVVLIYRLCVGVLRF